MTNLWSVLFLLAAVLLGLALGLALSTLIDRTNR